MSEIIPKDKFIENYGYVPFRYFQIIIFFLIILSFVFKDYIYNQLNQKIYSKLNKLNIHVQNVIKGFISIIPSLIILYYDSIYSSFSMKNIGATTFMRDRYINTILRLFGAYFVVQMTTHDIGIKIGQIQGQISKTPIIQFLIAIGSAYALTTDRSLAIIAGIMYYQIKFFA